MLELLTPAEMGKADRLAEAAGVPSYTLMENAGLAVADVACRIHPNIPPRVVVVAGPGNNGGDGFVAARLLRERGFPVRMLLLGGRERLRGDAAEAARRWTDPIEPAEGATLAGASMIVDALFGAGLDRPVQGEVRGLIEEINVAAAPVVAVDLPSGISGSSGAVMGAAVQATATVTFFRRKPGHLLLPGRQLCGSVSVADIGIPAAVLEQVRPRISLNAPGLWQARFPLPRAAHHKYVRGHAAVLSGPPASTGAARLAARAALRAGAGLVTLASGAASLPINAAASLAVMVRQTDTPDDWAAMLGDRRITAVLLGPGTGIGEGTRGFATAALASQAAVVLDADALTSFADRPEMLFSAIKSTRNAPTVLTPHEGEFARLFGKLTETTENTSKIERAAGAAAISGATVVLKGSDTVVASPQGSVSVAANAPPWLATAGSGDVLAGMIAGLLAQGMPAFEAASAAVWLHGETGNEAGPGLIADDLAEALRAVYRRLFVDLGAWP